MIKKTTHRALALGVIGALAAVPTALAKQPVGAGTPQSPGAHGKGHAKNQAKSVSYVFKGTYAGAGSVDVTKGNAYVKKANLAGTTVSFDLTNATFSVADTNSDGVSDVSDVAVGDKVVVKSRLPRKDPGSQPFAAKQLVDQTHPAA